MKNLEGRRVLITGAASGVGLECARAFSLCGAQLVISDVDEEALQPICAEISATGAECTAHACDVANDASVAALAAKLADSGPLDVLVNNAGVAFLGGFEQTPLSEWQRLWNVNVLGMVHCIRAFLPAMREAGGKRKVVNIASAAGFSPMPNMSAYAATKHAVVGLSEVLAMELHDTEISVLVVCPGIVNTAIVHVSPTSTEITGDRIRKLQAFYATDGCHPRRVADDVIRSVRHDDAFLFTGPLARLGSISMRVSRGMARRLAISTARKSGYLQD